MTYFPVPVHVHRRSGLQAAIEQELVVKAILTDGLIVELPIDQRERERIVNRWKRRAQNIYQFVSLQWNASEWTQTFLTRTPYLNLPQSIPGLQGLIQQSPREPHLEETFQFLVRDTILRDPPPKAAKKSVYTPPGGPNRLSPQKTLPV